MREEAKEEKSPGYKLTIKQVAAGGLSTTDTWMKLKKCQAAQREQPVGVLLS